MTARRVGRTAPFMTCFIAMLALASAACGGAAMAPVDSRGTSGAAERGEHRHGGAHGHHHEAMVRSSTAEADPIERKLDEVARIHGAPGPWAVAGYRMSEHALAKLGLERGSRDLEIVHFTPKEVRYSCIADGAAAHSGASLGKLNLSLVEASAEDVLTVYRNKKTGASIALRPAASFRERFADTPREKARELGREVLALPPEQVFEESPVK